MELRKIKDLIRTVESTSITEIEIENDGFRILIRRYEPQTEPSVVMTTQAAPVPITQPGEPSEIVQERALPDNVVEVVSPMVGTFYRAPAPDADPYAKIGDVVEQGQVIFIIEAMKIMNEIESEQRGRIVQFLVENGEPVEYGQPLARIELVK